jgi:hypothetical protein
MRVSSWSRRSRAKRKDFRIYTNIGTMPTDVRQERSLCTGETMGPKLKRAPDFTYFISLCQKTTVAEIVWPCHDPILVRWRK